VDEKGVSLIQAHTHRLGSHFKTWIDREMVGYEGGCLCKLTPEYKLNPNWQQGFCLATIFPDGIFQVQQIPIVRRKNGIMFAIYGNRIYQRKIKGENK